MVLKRIFAWMMVILWMAVIFYLSNQSSGQSNSVSNGLTQVIVDVIHSVIPQVHLDVYTLNHIVRKNAHFVAYMILGFAVMYALRTNGVKSERQIIYALLICMIYASSDEIHQIFVPGRGPQVSDVLIDSSGSAISVFLYYLFAQRRQRVVESQVYADTQRN